jgi:PPOX class probable F420-dependent enzyme
MAQLWHTAERDPARPCSLVTEPNVCNRWQLMPWRWGLYPLALWQILWKNGWHVCEEGCMIDLTTDFGQRVERRLRHEQVIWLTTVDAQGMPQPSPVWFLWDGSTILIYSQSNAPKIRNIEANGRVALHLDSDGEGGDIVVLTGDARVEREGLLATAVPAYVKKYRDGIVGIGMTPDSMAQVYRASIHVTPTKLRGH